MSPNACFSPSSIGIFCDAAEIGFETATTVFCQFGRVDRTFEPCFPWERSGRWTGNLGAEGRMEGNKIGIAFLDDEGSKRKTERNVVESIGLLIWSI